MFLLCFAVLFAVTSAATVCKCEEKKVNGTNLRVIFLEFEYFM